MITAYHRPKTLEEALALMTQPDTVALGGGTLINSPYFDKSRQLAVVDLQELALNQIRQRGDSLLFGACLTLQQLLDAPEAPDALKAALRLEAAANIRNMATLAGTLVACDGRSPFATAMLALDTSLLLVNKDSRQTIGLGEMLPLRTQTLAHKLIVEISIPLNVRLVWEYVARTPADRPIVSVALARWPGGRLRLAVGGFGPSPLLGLDAVDPGGLEPAARNALHGAGDEWASAEYRMEAGATLARRCLQALRAAA